MAVDPGPALRLIDVARHRRPGPPAGGLRQLRIVDERAVGREGLRNRANGVWCSSEHRSLATADC
jgi:hypothetical protein